MNESDRSVVHENTDAIVYGKTEESVMPGIGKLLSNVGVKELGVNNGLKISENYILSSKTRTNLINTVASEASLGLSAERIQLMQKAKLFDTNAGITSFNEIPVDEKLSNQFTEELLNVTEDSTKVNFVLRKVGFKEEQITNIAKTQDSQPLVSTPSQQLFTKTVINKNDYLFSS